MKKFLAIACLLCLALPAQATVYNVEENRGNSIIYYDKDSSKEYRDFVTQDRKSEGKLSESDVSLLKTFALEGKGEKQALVSLIAFDYWASPCETGNDRIKLFENFVKINLTEQNFVTFREAGIEFIMKAEPTRIDAFPDKQVCYAQPNLVARYMLEQVFKMNPDDNRTRFYYALSRFIFAVQEEFGNRSFFEAGAIYNKWLKKQPYNSTTHGYQKRFLAMVEAAHSSNVRSAVFQQTLEDIAEGVRKTEKRIDSCGWLYRLYDNCMSKKYF